MNALTLTKLYDNEVYMKIIKENNIFKLFKSICKLNLSGSGTDVDMVSTTIGNLMMIEQFNLITVLSKEEGMEEIADLISTTNVVSFKHHIANSP
jgi:hypothetical protein